MARLSKATSELDGGSAAYAGGTRLTNDACCCSHSKMNGWIEDETTKSSCEIGMDGIGACSIWMWTGMANAILLMLLRGIHPDRSPPGAERKEARVS